MVAAGIYFSTLIRMETIAIQFRSTFITEFYSRIAIPNVTKNVTEFVNVFNTKETGF